MPRPVDFGICDGGNSVYQLLTWCGGKDAEAVLPMMSEAEQYTLGVQAGQILKKIHAVPIPDTGEKWAVTFERRNNHELLEFEKCGICFEELAKLVAYLKDNRSLISSRQQSLIHNDYHNGNMMIDNGELIIIDFNDCGCGDPWEEFVQAVWQAQYYPHFSTGQVRGYFGGEPPEEFWQVLAYYTISHYPTYISWAKIFGEDEINKRIKQAQNFLKVCETQRYLYRLGI
jgi:serine/threonine-protein kinase